MAMSGWRALAMVAMACKGTETTPDPAPPPPSDGVAAAMRASVRRVDWPCGSRAVGSDGSHRATRLIYGELAACQVPVTVLWRIGGGCPIRIDARRPDGTWTTGKTIAYDAQHRLTSLDPYDYAWGVKGPLTRSLNGPPMDTYVALDTGAAMAGPNTRIIERYDLDAARHVIRIQENDSQRDLDYAADRLIHVRLSTAGQLLDTEDFLYDCAD